jgi:predicted aspartyl protease
MSPVNGQIIVPVQVDGHGPFLFRIDTGSSVPVTIDTPLAEQLGLGRSSTAPGGFAIDRLELGGATFRDLSAVTAATSTEPVGAPTPAVQGVLGFPFFHDVLLTIDYAAGTIELQQGSLSGEADDVVPLVGPVDTPQVPLQIGDHVYLARIDTGFVDNVVLPLDAAAQVRTDAAPAPVGRVQADGRSIEARSARLAEPLLVAGRRYDRLPVLFADLPTGPRLGYGLLAYFSLTFDQASGLVRIAEGGRAG